MARQRMMIILKWILGIIAFLLISFGAIYTYFSFEVGMGIMFSGIFLAAIIVVINERSNKKH